MQILENAKLNRSKKINKIEKIKELKTPMEAYEKIEEYAKKGYDSIPKEDKGFFLKCFGIFDKPATPNEFMMRVRVRGGQLNFDQAVALGEIAKEYCKDYMDLTTRAQVELRYIRIEDLPAILKKLESVGLNSYQTGVDNFRGIVADPLDALGYDNILPSNNLLKKLEDKFLKNLDFIGTLPRKFNTSITGSISNRCNAFGHDCCFVLAQKDGYYGYNLYLGGKVGKIAQNADIFLKSESEALKAYEAIMNLFKEYGFRDNRNKNRFYFLIESVGIKEIASAIRKEADINFLKAGITLTKMDNIDSDQGKTMLKDLSFAINAKVPAGIFSGNDLLEAARISKMYGSGDIRIDVEQNLYLMGIKEENIESILSEEFFKKYKNLASPYANHLIACAGEKHCQFGVIPNKPDAINLAKYLEKQVPLESDAKVRMYWSACVKGCGLHDLGDIGFEGCKAKLEGESVYGVHIFLGGRSTRDANIGKSVLKSVPLQFAKYFVESLMIEYKNLRKKRENFEEFYQRVLSNYSTSAIGFIMMLKTYIRVLNLKLDIGFKENVKTGKNEVFEIFEIGRALYRQIAGYEPYEIYDYFTPVFPKKLAKLKNIDGYEEEFLEMINNMLRSEKRVLVFSELHFEEMVYKVLS